MSMEEIINEARKPILPNGLPARAFRYDGAILECEHGDHPTYIHPLIAVNPDADGVDEANVRCLALIYRDDSIALTLDECVYEMWFIASGMPVGSRPQSVGWRLTPESVASLQAGAITPELRRALDSNYFSLSELQSSLSALKERSNNVAPKER